MIKVNNIKTGAAKKFAKFAKAVSAESVDPVVQRVAAKTQEAIKEKTRTVTHNRFSFTGKGAAGWRLEKVATAAYSVLNNTRAVYFLEKGRKAFSARIVGGKLKLLFIPLSAAADKSRGIYNKTLKRGVDFILAKKVKRQVAKKFIEKHVPVAKKLFRDEMRKHINLAMRK